MSLARHRVSALLSNKNLSPQKLGIHVLSHSIAGLQTKCAFHNCHINVVDVWNYKYEGGTADVRLHNISA
jgi:hypothetical protein